MKKYTLVSITILAFFCTNIFADISNFKFKSKDGSYQYAKIEDFKQLSSFKSVANFEAYYKLYIQKCLDDRHNDIVGIPCMIEADIWDRELNISYQMLYGQLDAKGKKDLKQAQRHWIQIRDLNLKLVQSNLSQEDGTMYRLINAGEVDDYLGDFTKQRTIFLRKYIK